MANRDYFSKPNQGNGRDAYNYGNSNLNGRQYKNRHWSDSIFIWFAVALTAYFVCQFLR